MPNGKTRLPAFAEFAMAVSAPSDPYAWIKVLDALISHPEQFKRRKEASAQAKKAASVVPLARFSLAELAYVKNQPEEARRELDLFFRAAVEIIEGRNPDVRQDMRTITFLYYLMYRGDPDLCPVLCRTSRPTGRQGSECRQ